jgi:hypothetical protein
LTSTVAVPSPLSKAPMPSGMPTKRQAGAVRVGRADHLVARADDRGEADAGRRGTRYGVSGVEGPTEEVAMRMRAPLFPGVPGAAHL